ncbi:MAG: hypothetical protein AAFN93_16010 [Bacteroidota bacterium]
MRGFEIEHFNKISSFLGKVSHHMITDIKEVLNGDYGLYEIYSKDDIEFYDFKVFANDYRINFIPTSANHIQLGFKKLLSEYPNGFVNDMNLDIDIDNYNFDSDGELARHNEFYVQLDKTVIEWFNQCWIKAGGTDQSDNYRISMYDLNRYFDLVDQAWVDL